jgi:very-short-patch-repair endonuclease
LVKKSDRKWKPVETDSEDTKRPETPVEFARFIRKHAMTPEKLLWQRLKSSQIGFKFSRQIRIGEYFVDFCCRQRRLVVELDGAAHIGKEDSDKERESRLRELGFEVIRFKNEEVYESVDEIVERIRKACGARPQWRY